MLIWQLHSPNCTDNAIGFAYFHNKAERKAPGTITHLIDKIRQYAKIEGGYFVYGLSYFVMMDDQAEFISRLIGFRLSEKEAQA